MSPYCPDIAAFTTSACHVYDGEFKLYEFMKREIYVKTTNYEGAVTGHKTIAGMRARLANEDTRPVYIAYIV